MYGALEKFVTKGVNWIGVSPYLDGQDEGHAACKCVPIGMQAGDVSYSIGYYLGSLGFLLLQKKGGEQARQAKI